MRCFIAVDIDEAMREEIARLQDDLQQKTSLKRSEAKWVEPENIHLTLKFLGEVRDQEISEICRIVEGTAADYERFSLEIEGVGTFGSPARVLWAGLRDKPVLDTLQEHLEERLANAGWPRENKKFNPHLTLCRIKSAHAGKVLQKTVQAKATEPLGTVFIDSICVYKSDLTNKGPVYTLISRSMLK